MKKIKTYILNLPKITKWIVCINIIVYVIFSFVGLTFKIHLQDYFGAYPTYSENFNLFTIPTSMFVHSMDPTHVILNMIFILIFSPFVENKLGTKNFLISYFFIGFLGFISVNYSYYENRTKILKSINNVGVNIDDITITNGEVSDTCLLNMDSKTKNVVMNYGYVVSKTYGASSALYGIFILYLFLNIFEYKKVIFNLLVIYFISNTIFEVFSCKNLLNSSEFVHFGGVIGGIIVFLLYKTKKVIIR